MYRAVLQDVLSALGDGLTLDKHVLARAKSSSQADRQSLESVLLKMGAHISKSVFGTWDNVFHRPGRPKMLGRKEIIVALNKEANGLWYIQLRLKDGAELYTISERSLGFQWFFTYLLLIEYRGFRHAGSRNVVFLLDEPASNLHPSAQAQLLSSFNRLPGSSRMIYTTHSHYMINPNWLESAYVVKNEAMTYEAEDDYSARRTNITATKYRQFAVTHPTQTTYFQPILDVLEHVPSSLDNVPSVVMVEGKNDLYSLRYFERLLPPATPLNLVPGTGAGSLDCVIRLYLGWGRTFVVLLDSDEEGEKQKARYSKTFGPAVKNRLFGLRDLIPSIKGKEMEHVFESADLLGIQQAAYPDATKFNRTHFHRAIQEFLLREELTFRPTAPTLANAKRLVGALHSALAMAATDART